ncbi:diguanylate cyclase (GGDEF) domain-containing protein [Devosia enhydra]|uniref:Diguanylate cyclase (GGDEF) domain-containing protein n=1 Tax=Devosia enhydra TaxID=665118 RepID=A0A1K2HYY6_9HYPH|nr:EAL domain-containing protein [Devosia enhydra]SFZ85324.1 diguanylate cyclase (GGDEF) domain-containing protein [Devosia enhydra]
MIATELGTAFRSDEALLLDAALETMPYGFCVWSPDFRLVMWNRNYCSLYGFPPDRITLGMPLDAVVRLSIELGNHPGLSAEAFLTAYKKELLDNRGGARAKSQERASGGRVIETGHVFAPGLGWVVTHEDVTEEIATSELVQRRKRELERQNMRLDAAVNNISQGLSMFDAMGRLVISNQPFQRIYELPETLLAPGTTFDAIMAYLFAQGMNPGTAPDAYLRWRRTMIANGEFGKTVHEFRNRTIMVQHHPTRDGGWVTTHEDITEQRQQEARIRHLARHDALTELPNRIQFLEEMAAIEPLIERGEKAAVLCVDLDHFKLINDTLGHAVGDALLKQASARLWGTTRENDVLARIGGDEFTLLIRPIERPSDAAAVADRIVKAMAMPFSIEGNLVSIGASVGIALAPDDGSDADTLMKNADLALYKAKSEGRSTFHFFEPGMDAAIQKRRTIETGLRTALEDKSFRLAFQPLFGLRENRITGFEALLRWHHPERGEISPGEFIPAAEETGLIVPIGDWVLREACKVAAGWPGRQRVAVNLSPVQFKNPQLYETVQQALADSGLSPSRLELEITESLLLIDNDSNARTLHRLRALGVRVSMDDFGTGYSSLSYLRSFPFDRIKIDRSFMRDLESRPDSRAIIRAVIGLGRSLGMQVTAEGVETREQLDAMREDGMTEIQGFLISAAVPPEAIAGLLARDPLASAR